LEKRWDLGSKLSVATWELDAGVAASVTGEGGSRDTSMGFSPLSGVMMGTRCGDLDPGIIQSVSNSLHMSPDQVTTKLNHSSGFLGIAGTSDSRDLEEKFLEGDDQAALAIEMFCYGVAKTIASYIVPLQGIDAIIFTGGIGEKSFIKRKKIADHLKFLGVELNETNNNNNGKNSEGRITLEESRIQAFVIKTNEELMIARQVYKLFS